MDILFAPVVAMFCVRKGRSLCVHKDGYDVLVINWHVLVHYVQEGSDCILYFMMTQCSYCVCV